jgi:hypothetical protein
MIHPPYMLHHAGISPIIHLYEIMKYEMMKWMQGDGEMMKIYRITFGDSDYFLYLCSRINEI